MADTGEPEAPSIETLREQERRLVLQAAGLEQLYALGRRLTEAAIAERLPIVVQIRLGERLVFSAAAPGSTANNNEWAARKARVTHLLEQSSLLVRLVEGADGVDAETRHRLPPDRYAAHGGAFPLRTADAGFIGSIVVSGLPQLADHAFVVRQLEAFLLEGQG